MSYNISVFLTFCCVCISIKNYSQHLKTEKSLDFPKKNEITNFNGFQLDIAQDFFGIASKNEDRDFTMGVQLKWLGLKTENDLTFLWSEPQKFIDSYIFKINSKLIHHEFIVGYSAFTPRDLASSSPVFDDRPYAAVLFGQTNRYYKTANWVISSSFSIGGVGGFSGDIANYVQTAIHAANRRIQNFTREDPNGWNNQIANRGLPFINYSHRRFFNQWQDVNTKRKFNYGITPYYGGSIGLLYNNLNGGINFKIGFYENNFSSYTPEEVNKSNTIPTEINANSKTYNKLQAGIYLFGNSQATLWAYNSTLQGVPIFKDKDAHRLSYDEIKPLVALFELGIGAYLNNTEIRYSHSLRTSQTDLPTQRPHFWGTVKLIFHSF